MMVGCKWSRAGCMGRLLGLAVCRSALELQFGCSVAPDIHTPQHNGSHAQHCRYHRGGLARGPQDKMLVGGGSWGCSRLVDIGGQGNTCRAAGVHRVEAGGKTVDHRACFGHRNLRHLLAWHPAAWREGRRGQVSGAVLFLPAQPPTPGSRQRAAHSAAAHSQPSSAETQPEALTGN